MIGVLNNVAEQIALAHGPIILATLVLFLVEIVFVTLLTLMLNTVKEGIFGLKTEA
jgi:hypothetical protein